jgi:hypothetical protein
MQKVFRVDIDARFGPFNGCSGWTALSIAAFMGHAAVVEILRRHGANPLLGTGFHADAFAVTQIVPTTQLSLGSSMDEYINMGCGKNQFLCDRRPIPVSSSHADQKRLEVWQLPRKRLQIEEAKRIDTALNRPEVERRTELTTGAFLRCIGEDVEVYQSASSYTEIGKMHSGEIAVVSGPPEEFGGYVMIPIQIPIRLKSGKTCKLKCCYVELDCFETYETDEMMARTQRRRVEESCFYSLKLQGDYAPYVDEVKGVAL